MEDEQKGNIVSLIPKSWITEDSYEFIFRIYSSLGVPFDIAQEVYKGLSKTEFDIDATNILLGIIKIGENCSVDEFFPIWHSGADGIDSLYLQMGWNVIERWRHNYAHNGENIEIPVNTRSFLQFVYLDLLFQELNLETKGFTVTYIKSGYGVAHEKDTDSNRNDNKLPPEQEIAKIKQFWTEFVKLNSN